MNTNWRGEPANVCWMCGGTDTVQVDGRTRDCKTCGNWYAVFPAYPSKEEDDAPDQDAPRHDLEPGAHPDGDRR